MINFDSQDYPENLVPIPLCKELVEIGFKEPCIFSVYKANERPYSVKDISFELKEQYYEGFPDLNYLNLDKDFYGDSDYFFSTRLAHCFKLV